LLFSQAFYKTPDCPSDCKQDSDSTFTDHPPSTKCFICMLQDCWQWSCIFTLQTKCVVRICQSAQHFSKSRTVCCDYAGNDYFDSIL